MILVIFDTNQFAAVSSIISSNLDILNIIETRQIQIVLCISFTETGGLLTGSNKVAKAIYNTHVGGVFSICFMKDRTFLSGGG
ncbi:hypothetical protein TNCT_363621 [Trichonephila clavata]|uniref:Uncharacterized protein n=1 Tax=Trichonephila clavata TaxID=2740835 RepID=A0A8X6IG37_TRICU|nr:hypothetical protein TNCT_363621 [Trichonephila clavata]